MKNVFGDRLKELRARVNLSQEELAEILNISRTAVSKWESGRGYPNLETLKSIAEYFSVTVDSLISEETPIPEESETINSAERKRLLVSGLPDCLMISLLVLPLFKKIRGDLIVSVPIFLSDMKFLPRVGYITLFFISLASGIFQLVLASFYSESKLEKIFRAARIFSIVSGVLLVLYITSTPPNYADSIIIVIESAKFLLMAKTRK